MHRVQSPLTCKLGDTHSQRVRGLETMQVNFCNGPHFSQHFLVIKHLYTTFPTWHPTIVAGFPRTGWDRFPNKCSFSPGFRGQTWNVRSKASLQYWIIHSFWRRMGCTCVRRTTHSQVRNIQNLMLVAPQCDKKQSEFLCHTCPIDSLKCLVPCCKVDVERHSLQCTIADVWWNSSHHALSCDEDVWACGHWHVVFLFVFCVVSVPLLWPLYDCLFLICMFLLAGAFSCCLYCWLLLSHWPWYPYPEVLLM